MLKCDTVLDPARRHLATEKLVLLLFESVDLQDTIYIQEFFASVNYYTINFVPNTDTAI